MRFNDAIIGSGCFLFGVVVIFLTSEFPTLKGGYPGPSLFPNVLSVLFMISGVGLIFKGFRSREPWIRISQGINMSGLINSVLVLAVILFYIFFSEMIGFLLISTLLLTVLMICLRRNFVSSLISAGAVSLGIYLLFAKILLVPLPSGLLGWG